ncbi:hypothetical protein, partial [Streptomyces sp. GC420]|uniref:hypothetical protein n=1 Tax=Streptomyces sp. GC420 TaxID=2697568 RepID=UPI001414F6D9
MRNLLRPGTLSAAVGMGLCLAALPAGQAQAQTYVPCNNVTALGNAINQANAGGGLIVLAPNCTYTISAPDNPGDALPEITGNVSIAARNATIRRAPDAAEDFRIFHVVQDGRLTLTSVTVSGGSIGEFPYLYGGGILNDRGTVNLVSATVRGNEAFSGGGVYSSQGTLSLSRSTVEENTAYQGAGVANAYGTTTISGGALRSNTSTFAGALLNYPQGTATLNGVSVTGNIAGSSGGGVYNGADSVLRLNSTTVSGNTAEWGGGLFNDESTATLVGSRVTGNTAHSEGGGVYEYSGAVNLLGSVVTRNTPDNCFPEG